MSKFKLELYVSGKSPASLQAVDNIKQICDEHLPGNYELEVIDVDTKPERAEEAHILAIPTLIKTAPMPLRRLIGGLKVKNRVLAGLDIPFSDIS